VTFLNVEVSGHRRGGIIGLVKLNRVIARRIAYDRDGINLRADVNAAIAVNVDESSGEVAQSDQRSARETRQTAQASSSRRPKPDAPDD
jgi:hypothetical protein